jgi:hypothetical protein
MEVKAAKGYVFHRDPLAPPARRWGLSHNLERLSDLDLLCLARWRTAVSVLGVCCTLFASFDTPAPHLVKYIIGSVWGVLISLFYSFVLLPQVTDFAVLVAVLAPAYLLAGSLQARPPTTFMAMGITLTLPILCELGAHYSGDFAGAINTVDCLVCRDRLCRRQHEFAANGTGRRSDKPSAETMPTRYPPQRERCF